MVYNSLSNKVVRFGGVDILSGFNPSGDTWDKKQFMGTRQNMGPSGRAVHSMIYDNNKNVIILFGGVHDAGVGFRYLGTQNKVVTLTPKIKLPHKRGSEISSNLTTPHSM